MNIVEATKQYEKWMGCCTPIVQAHLRDKHEQMRADLFALCRDPGEAQRVARAVTEQHSSPGSVAGGEFRVYVVRSCS